MEENNNDNFSTYKTVEIKKEKNKTGFGKSFVLPFFSGILGTTLVLGTCFGVPSIKNKILQDDTVKTIQTNSNSQATTQAVSLSEYSDTSISVAQKVLPSIVGIKIEYSINSPYGLSLTSTGSASGSGVIISEDGYILTNNHVVNPSSSSSFYSLSEATKVSVNLYNDETLYDATIVGTDSLTDLAVIKIDKTGLTAATLGDSDSVQVGEFAMAIGNPLGLQSSITCGVISALNRKITDTDGTQYNLIQTDTAINSGNSGGALVNANGEVIGINTLKLAGSSIEGMGFSIPINSTKDVYNQLIQYNKVKRPYIGITGLNIDEETAKKYNLVVGVYVQSVENFTAAQKAEIKAGDVITAINGTKITKMDELNNLKNTYNIGDKITITLYRDGQEKNIELTLEEQP